MKKYSGLLRAGLLFLGGIALLLVILFWKSLLPDFVHFSNDGPLGLRASEYYQEGNLTGIWADANWLGANWGTFFANVSYVLHGILSPVGIAKWFAPISLFFLGASAWLFFRQLKFASVACVLGGLAAMLNSSFMSAACWGVCSQPVSFGFDFLALAAMANTTVRPWIRAVLAGFAIGLAVTESYDIAVLFSVMLGFFAFYQFLVAEGSLGKNFARATVRTVLIAGCAMLIAAQSISVLITTQIKGVSVVEETRTKQESWDWATQWSLPKKETLNLIIPGLFGFRMDTPNNMEMFADSFQNGQYWGAIGRDPNWDRFLASDKQGQPPGGFLRYTGGGNYNGVLVALIAAWASLQSFRKKESVFAAGERKLIWFWGAVLVVSLPLAWGRFAPFYKIPYDFIPYFSVFRNPAKFLHLFSFALVILFGYGVNGLYRRYLSPQLASSPGIGVRFKSWWTKATVFDRRWVVGCIGFIGASVLGWLIYYASRQTVVNHYLELQQLAQSPFDESTAEAMIGLSLQQVGWYLLFLILSVGCVVLILCGVFSGRRARIAGVMLGAILLFDLCRANLPFLVYWNYKEKYASNPIVDLLRDKPYEHRVVQLPFRPPDQLSLFKSLYDIEWVQQLFQYYNIQSLDIVQAPRMPRDMETFQKTFPPYPISLEAVRLMPRRWELTNTRYLLGPAGYLELLNTQVDPQRRFHIVTNFSVVYKPGVERATQLEQLTAEPSPNGPYALFEFTGALPRAKLYTHLEVITNDQETLKELTSPAFNPAETVLLADAPATAATNSIATSTNTGTVEFAHYSSRDIVLKTSASEPSVLLLNDKYDPDWKVFVDGKPEKILRANYVVRGVYLPAGPHTVEFVFRVSPKPLYVSLGSLIVGALLLTYLVVGGRSEPPTVQEQKRDGTLKTPAT